MATKLFIACRFRTNHRFYNPPLGILFLGPFWLKIGFQVGNSIFGLGQVENSWPFHSSHTRNSSARCSTAGSATIRL